MLCFDEAKHEYRIDGELLQSVSDLVKTQWKSFKVKEVATATFLKYHQDESSKYFGMTVDGIIEAWRANGKERCDLGRLLHKNIEIYFTSGNEPPDNQRKTPDWQQFKNFLYDHPDWELVECEKQKFRLRNKRKNGYIGTAGTIDAIFKTPDGYVVVDWKRVEKIKFDGYSAGIDHMRHVPDANFYRYSLQISLYSGMVDIEIVAGYIVQFHPGQEDYIMYKTHDFHIESERILS